jgi:hypothetical protein
MVISKLGYVSLFALEVQLMNSIQVCFVESAILVIICVHTEEDSVSSYI